MSFKITKQETYTRVKDLISNYTLDDIELFSPEEAKKLKEMQYALDKFEAQHPFSLPGMSPQDRVAKIKGYDWAGNYNSEFLPEETSEYDKWLVVESEKRGRDLKEDLKDYDLQGYWKERQGQTGTDTDGQEEEGKHLPDKYKKPNHPTFSEESIYSGQDFTGGKWEQLPNEKWQFTPSKDNLEFTGEEQIREYFAKYEPDSVLNLPTTKTKAKPTPMPKEMEDRSSFAPKVDFILQSGMKADPVNPRPLKTTPAKNWRDVNLKDILPPITDKLGKEFKPEARIDPNLLTSPGRSKLITILDPGLQRMKEETGSYTVTSPMGERLVFDASDNLVSAESPTVQGENPTPILEALSKGGNWEQAFMDEAKAVAVARQESEYKRASDYAKEHPYFASLKSGFISIPANIDETFLRMAGNEFGQEWRSEFSEKMQPGIDGLLDIGDDTNKKGILELFGEGRYKDGFKKALRQSINSAPVSLTAMGLTMAGQPGLALGAMYLTGKGASYSEIEQMAEQSGLNLDVAQLELVSTLHGISEAGSEVIGDIIGLGAINDMVKKWGRRQATKGIAKMILSRLAMAGGGALIQGTTEGIEEGVNQLAKNAINASMKLDSWDNLFAGVGESMVGGFSSGLLMQGVPASQVLFQRQITEEQAEAKKRAWDKKVTIQSYRNEDGVYDMERHLNDTLATAFERDKGYEHFEEIENVIDNLNEQGFSPEEIELELEETGLWESNAGVLVDYRLGGGDLSGYASEYFQHLDDQEGVFEQEEREADTDRQEQRGTERTEEENGEEKEGLKNLEDYSSDVEMREDYHKSRKTKGYELDKKDAYRRNTKMKSSLPDSFRRITPSGSLIKAKLPIIGDFLNDESLVSEMFPSDYPSYLPKNPFPNLAYRGASMEEWENIKKGGTPGKFWGNEIKKNYLNKEGVLLVGHDKTGIFNRFAENAEGMTFDDIQEVYAFKNKGKVWVKIYDQNIQHGSKFIEDSFLDETDMDRQEGEKGAVYLESLRKKREELNSILEAKKREGNQIYIKRLSSEIEKIDKTIEQEVENQGQTETDTDRLGQEGETKTQPASTKNIKDEIAEVSDEEIDRMIAEASANVEEDLEDGKGQRGQELQEMPLPTEQKRLKHDVLNEREWTVTPEGEAFAGEVFKTVTGRETTPYPKLSARRSRSDMEKKSLWLRDNAIKEAESRGDGESQGLFTETPIPTDRYLTESDSAWMLEYIFKANPESIRIQKITKPLIPAKEKVQTKGLSEEAIQAQQALTRMKANLKSAGNNVVLGAKEVADLLNSKSYSFPGQLFDPEVYDKLKPYFINALEDSLEAGKNLAEFIGLQIKLHGKNVAPYVKNFIVELREEMKKESTNDTERVDSQDSGAGKRDNPSDNSEVDKARRDGAGDRESGNPSGDTTKESLSDNPPLGNTEDDSRDDGNEQKPGDLEQSSARKDNGESLPRTPRHKLVATASNGNIDLRKIELKKLTKKERIETNTRVLDILSKSDNRELTKEDYDDLIHYSGVGGIETDTELSLSQYYTPQPVIADLWDKIDEILQNSSKKIVIKKVLESSAGSGRFIGQRPEYDWTACELDEVNAKILSRLYPGSKVIHSDFAKVRETGFDLAIGNVPFSTVRSDLRLYPQITQLHDFFILHNLDLLNEGGIGVFLTSSGTLDKVDSTARKLMIDQANVLGCYRMPIDTFKDAGTRVSTDLLILQKRPNGIKPIDVSEEQQRLNSLFLESKAVRGVTANSLIRVERGAWLGYSQVETNRFGKQQLVVGSAEYMTLKKLKLMATPSYEIAKPKKNKADKKIDSKEFYKKAEENRTFYLKLGDRDYPMSIVVNKGRVLVLKEVVEFSDVEEHVKVYEDVDNSQIKGQVLLLQKILEAGNAYQETGIKGQEEALFAQWEEDYKKHPLKDPSLAKFFKAYKEEILFESYASHFAKGKVAPGEVFKKKVRHKDSGVFRLKNAKTLLERGRALENENAVITTESLKKLTQNELDELIGTHYAISKIYPDTGDIALENNIFYYSGNVIRKAEQLELALPKVPTEWKRIIEEQINKLYDTRPATIPLEAINLKGNEEWFEDYWVMFPELGIYKTNKEGVTVYYCKNELYEKYLNGKSLVNQEKDEPDSVYRRKLDEAIEKVEEMKQKLKSLIDERARHEIETAYNHKFNNYVRPDYMKGAYLIQDVLDKINAEGRKNTGNPNFSLRQNQVEWAVQVFREGKGINAHDMGGGKTYSAIANIRILKEFGISNKHLLVVPANTMPKWEKEIRHIWGDCKLINLYNLPAKTRDKALARVANESADIVMISGNALSSIPKGAELVKSKLRSSLSSILEDKSNKAFAEAEKKLNRYISAELTRSHSAPQTSLFENLGIDGITVDEAHHYKNVGLSPKVEGGIEVKMKTDKESGLVSFDSARSYDLRLKLDHILENNNQKNVFLLTGTPVDNKPMELYTMLRHLGEDVIQNGGWRNEIGFYNHFMDSDRKEGKSSKYVRWISNIITLRSFISRYIDYRPIDTLPITIPEVEPIHIYLRQSPGQAIVMSHIEERLEQTPEEMKEVGDSVGAIFTGARVGAIDARFYRHKFFATPVTARNTDPLSDKAEAMLEELSKEWKKDPSGGYLVFSDFNANYADSTVFEGTATNYHEEIKYKIMKRFKLKPEEIAIISGMNITDPKTGKDSAPPSVASTKNERKQEISDLFNSGKIKIVIGTTLSMGEGMNFDQNGAGVFMLDIPFKPGEIDQRLKRVARQGNKRKHVKVWYFMQEGTYDELSWKIVNDKQGWVNALFSPKFTDDTVDLKELGGEDSTPNAEQQKIYATSDPFKKEQLIREQKLREMSAYRKSLWSKMDTRAGKIKNYNVEIEDRELKLKVLESKLKQDIENLETAKNDKSFTDKQRETLQKGIESRQKLIEKAKEMLARKNKELKEIEEEHRKIKEEHDSTLANERKFAKMWKDKDGLFLMPLRHEVLKHFTTEDIVSVSLHVKSEMEKLMAEMKESNPDYYKLMDENISTPELMQFLASKDNYTYHEHLALLPILEERSTRMRRNASYGGYNQFPSANKMTYEKLKLNPVGFPEMVRLVKDLTGKHPQVKKLSFELKGYFTSKRERITLNSQMFEGTDREDHTLAHEIGHLVDYLPDGRMARGNMLGHLLSLNDFRKEFFTGNPGDTENLLKKRKNLMAQLRRANEGVKTRLSVDEIVSRIEEIESKFMINSELLEEMRNLSFAWRPLPEVYDEMHIAYRNKATEIYADFISALLNDPKWTNENAPKAMEIFFKYLSEKPSVAKRYFELMDMLTHDDDRTLDYRVAKLREDYKEGVELFKLYYELAKKHRLSYTSRFLQGIWDKYYLIQKEERKLLKEGKIDGDMGLSSYVLEQKSFWDLQDRLSFETANEIIRGLEEQGFTEEDISIGMQLLRSASEKKAESGGLQGEYGIETARHYFNKEFPGRGAKLVEALYNLQEWWHEEIIEKATDIMTPELRAEINQAKEDGYFYSPEMVQEKFLDNPITGRIFKKVGHLGADMPHLAVFLKKGQAILKAIRWNDYVKRVWESNFQYLESSEKAVIKYVKSSSGKLTKLDPPPKRFKKVIYWKENGKLQAAYIDSNLYRAFVESPVDSFLPEIMKVVNNVIKGMLTTYNPVFNSKNPFRDALNNYLSLSRRDSNISLPMLLAYSVKALPHAWNKATGKRDAVIDEMESMATIYHNFSRAMTDKNYDKNLSEVNNFWRQLDLDYKKPQRKLGVEQIVTFGEWVRVFSDVLEAVGKIAPHMYLKDYDPLFFRQSEAVASFIRNRCGTPPFMKSGTWSGNLNTVLLFMNVGKEGIRNTVQTLAFDKETRANAIMKLFRIAILPPILVYLLEAGLLKGKEEDDDWLEWARNAYSAIPDYDKTNYICIPIKYNPENMASIYIRIPTHEALKPINILIRKLLMLNNGQNTLQNFGDIAQIPLSVLPGVNPAIEITANWFKVAVTSDVPRDSYYKFDILDQATIDYGSFAEKTMPMLYWTLGKLGLRLPKDYSDFKTPFERVINVSQMAQGLVKESNRGWIEQIANAPALTDLQRHKAKRMLTERRFVRSYVHKYVNTVDNPPLDLMVANYLTLVRALYRDDPEFAPQNSEDLKRVFSKYLTEMAREEGDMFIRKLSMAKSGGEKAIMMQQTYHILNNEKKFNEYLKTALKYKIVSAEQVTEVLKSIYYTSAKINDKTGDRRTLD